MVDNEFIEIDLARKFQDSLRKSTAVKCDSPEIESKLFSYDPDSRLIVISTINSPKNIIFVDEYEKYLKDIFK